MSLQQGPWDPTVLAGSVAVLTGAGHGGIGWGLAKHCAGILRMHIVLIDLKKDVVDAACAHLAEMYPSVRVVGQTCDVTDRDGLRRCASAIEQEFVGARVGAVFANAGIFLPGSIKNSSLEDWTLTFNVNVVGVVNTVQAFLPLLQGSNEPSILATTSSVDGVMRGDASVGAYQASKHAVVSLTETLSFELARKSPQIRVHSLCPCLVKSSLGATSASGAGEDDLARIRREMGLTDLIMTVEAHAQQVFDCIGRGEFYVVAENTRPYVDHDFVFGAQDLMRERFEGMLQRRLDNRDALGDSKHSSATLKGPIIQEGRRRALAAASSKL